jgi:hypothetical protein
MIFIPAIDRTMKWVDALKEYAKVKGKYVVPRKGTPEYDEVKKLMGKEHKDAVKADVEMGQAKRDMKKMEKVAEKPKAPRKKKSAEAKAVDAKAVEAVMMPAKEKAKAVRKPRAKKEGLAAAVGGGATARSDERSKNPEAIFQSATNLHEPIAPPAALGGNLAELKKDVAKVRKPRSLPVLIEKEQVVNEKPFSFVDFKRKIGA